MGGPTFLTLSQVNRLHARALAEHGGQEGVREPGLVDSALASAKNTFWYAGGDHFDIAAAYAFHLAESQAFVDGNKRVAAAAALVFCHRSLQKGPPRVEIRRSKSPTPLSTGISGHYGLKVFKRLLSFQWFSIPRSGASPARVLRRRGGVPDGGRAAAGRSAAVGR